MRELIVDGYNVVHAWPEVRRTMHERSLQEARAVLVRALAEYAAQTGVRVTVVFDARASTSGTREEIDGVTVLYGTKLASADHVIERLANEAARRGDAADVVVATGDRLQRAMVGAMGAATMSAVALLEEVQRVAAGVTTETQRRQTESRRAQRVEDQLDPDVVRRLEKLRRGESDA